MSRNKKWIDRKFEFIFPVQDYIQLIERLKYTPSRIEELIDKTPPDILVQREGSTWSIQENVGHLLSVDYLFQGRLEDYQNHLEQLRPANMSGGSTDQENYNNKQITDILSKFKDERVKYISKLEQLPEDEFARTCFHPRLKEPMRLCDMLYFQAEHDEHHISRILELKELFMNDS